MDQGVTLLTTRQAAVRAGVSRQTISRWVRSGLLQPAVRGNGDRGALFFAAADIDAAIAGAGR